MREQRKVGPSDLTGGLLADAEQARQDRLPPDELAALLASYRAGDQEAGKRLQQALRHVPYTFFEDVRPTARLSAEDVLGILFAEFGQLIERLRYNQIAPDKVEGYIRGDLQHAVTHYMGECSQRIAPRHSTNSERRKRGLEPYKGLSRVASGSRSQDDSDNGDETVTTNKLEDPLPYDDLESDLYGDLWAVTLNSVEEEFVGLLCGGHGLKEVAEILGVSLRQARKIKDRLKARLLR